eukprot:scaffold1518_cov417-Prasinococcus_capsulatus_cf.AAC.1
MLVIRVGNCLHPLSSGNMFGWQVLNLQGPVRPLRSGGSCDAPLGWHFAYVLRSAHLATQEPAHRRLEPATRHGYTLHSAYSDEGSCRCLTMGEESYVRLGPASRFRPWYRA